MIDKTSCTGCLLCEMACSLTKSGRVGHSKSAIRVLSDDHRGLDVPVVCRHCKAPPCEKVCPVNAIVRNKNSGAVLLNKEKCIGCNECVPACPFRAIHMDSEDAQLIKCDLCGGKPECVEWCPTGAIRFVEIRTLVAEKVLS